MTMPRDFIGVDIAKSWIDVHFLSSGTDQRIQTTDQGLSGFAQAARGCFVTFEASGFYTRAVSQALDMAGVSYACLNPRQVRDFARFTGKLAKTDRLDAQVLARMGQMAQPKPTPPTDQDRLRLADLVARRDDLVGLIGAERNRVQQVQDRWISDEITRLINVLKDHLGHVEAQIAALVAAQGPLAEANRRLQSMPGIGPVLGPVLIARLPELGQMDRRQIASLAGLAPHACDSGLHRGKRRIWGGRADVRRALYLAAFIASRRDPTFKAFRSRLQSAGKPPKLAITACARKLLTILNAMFRNGENFKKHT